MSGEDAEKEGEQCDEAKTERGSSWHNNVALLQQHRVDHVDDSVGALHVWPEHVDPFVVPLYVVTWNSHKRWRSNKPYVYTDRLIFTLG